MTAGPHRTSHGRNIYDVLLAGIIAVETVSVGYAAVMDPGALSVTVAGTTPGDVLWVGLIVAFVVVAVRETSTRPARSIGYLMGYLLILTLLAFALYFVDAA